MNHPLHTLMKRILFLLGLILLASSCVTHQELLNFNEGADFPLQPVDIANIPEIRIQPDDILAISVQTRFSLNSPDVQNLNNEGGNVPGSQLEYLVDSEGFIDFPMVGKVQLSDLTVREAKEKLTEQVRTYLQEPIVNVRFVSFKFTILGEVNGEGTFTLPEERITILDALGLAGGVTEYANRTNLLVIREENGKRQFGRISLQSRQIFDSPYYYLRPNDVIYVEPLKEKVGTVSDQFTKVLPWLGAGTALLNLILILTRTR